MRDPFPVFTTLNLSLDQRTRIALYAFNLGVDASAVTVQAEDAQHVIYPLTVEYVGNNPGNAGLTQLVVKLPDGLANGGDVWLSLNLRGVVSNKALISIKPSANNSP